MVSGEDGPQFPPFLPVFCLSCGESEMLDRQRVVKRWSRCEQTLRSLCRRPRHGVIGETYPSVIGVPVGAHQHLTFPEQIDRLIAPEPHRGVDVAHGDAVHDSFDDPAQRSNAVDELLTQLFDRAVVADDHGTNCLEGPAQPEVCHAGAGVSANDGMAMRGAGVTTTALRTSAGRAFVFALVAALADEAVAAAKPVTMVSETAATARRRRTGVAVEVVDVMR